jgi:hypothetical protein
MHSRRILDRSARTSPTSSAHTGLNADFFNYYQCFGSGFIEPGSGSNILGWIPIRIQGFFMTKKWKKFTAEKKIWVFFGSKIAIYTYQGLHKGCPCYRGSLKISKFFPIFVIIFAPLDLDPVFDSGSTDLIESGSNPDKKHWLWLLYYMQLLSSKATADAFVKHSSPSPFLEKFQIC